MLHKLLALKSCNIETSTVWLGYDDFPKNNGQITVRWLYFKTEWKTKHQISSVANVLAAPSLSLTTVMPFPHLFEIPKHPILLCPSDQIGLDELQIIHTRKFYMYKPSILTMSWVLTMCMSEQYSDHPINGC